MRSIPFNTECQTKNCNGNLIPIENYEYKEHTKINEHTIKYKCSHNITAYQCVECGRIHGKVTLTTGEIVEFFEGNCNTKPVHFQTPSEYGKAEAVSAWN